MLGTLTTTDDGRCVLRFERRLQHPRERVWRALTRVDDLRQWFVSILDYDRLAFEAREGAELVFVATTDRTTAASARGRMVHVDPPRLLEYTWGSETLRWELEPDGPGACTLVFENTFDGPDAAAALGAGWHAGLERLGAVLDGRPIDQPAWDDLTAAYTRALR